VDGLEAEFEGQLRVVRVNVQSDSGEEFARQYGNFTPTFVFFDPQGEEVWREIGLIDAEQVRQSMP